MSINDISETTLGGLRAAGAYLTDLATPTVRLGVTGFARAGKTIFITALVRNLVAGGRLPFFGPAAEGRIVRAYLEPQPDDDVPRFAYEDHLARLARDPPDWPDSTRRISQLRVTIEYAPTGFLRSYLGVNRLHLDIVDYPGEWLVDLGLMPQSFEAWSLSTLRHAAAPARAMHAAAFRTFLAGLPENETPEQIAIAGAARYTAYLALARTDPTMAATGDPGLGPGRFLMPGDLEGSPLLTFFPYALGDEPTAPQRALAALLARRFEAYKAKVVRPFFRDHFARLDRQIVLVDALTAIDAGGTALTDLETTLTNVLQVFRPGAARLLSLVLPRRIDRILFAATKADHLHSANHDRLAEILDAITQRAQARSALAGATVKAMALAALRTTREAEVTAQGERLACIVGTPLAGEHVGEERFDGTRSAAIFPGDLPRPADLLDHPDGAARPDLRIVRFQPPRIPADARSGMPAPWPHIRLDRALDFLIGDRLA